MKKNCLWVCCLLGCLTGLRAQVTDTVPVPDTLRILTAAADSLGADSTLVLTPKRGPVRAATHWVAGGVGGFFTKKYPNPRKAAFMSLVIPGSGQDYNRKWWKIPIVYGAIGGLAWWDLQKIEEYRLYRDNYKWKVDGNSETNVTDPKLVNLDATTLKANRDISRQNVEQTSLILGLAYLLAVTDAFVDAHMATFDVSDDLSLRFKPSLQSAPTGPALGIGLAFTLR